MTRPTLAAFVNRFENAPEGPDQRTVPERRMVSKWHLHPDADGVDGSIARGCDGEVRYDYRAPYADGHGKGYHAVLSSWMSAKTKPGDVDANFEVGRQVWNLTDCDEETRALRIGVLCHLADIKADMLRQGVSVNGYYGNGWLPMKNDDDSDNNDMLAWTLSGKPHRLIVSAYGRVVGQSWWDTLAEGASRATGLCYNMRHATDPPMVSVYVSPWERGGWMPIDAFAEQVRGAVTACEGMMRIAGIEAEICGWFDGAIRRDGKLVRQGYSVAKPYLEVLRDRGER